MPDTDSVLTTAEAMGYLKISRPTFLKYVYEGRIHAVKAGKGWRILKSELNRFLRGEVAPLSKDSPAINGTSETARLTSDSLLSNETLGRELV